MVLRKIVHYIASAIHRARAYTADADEGYQRSGIAFKTKNGNGTKYANVNWQSIEREVRESSTVRTVRLFVMKIRVLHAMFSPVIVVTAKRSDITIYSTAEIKCVVMELTVPAEENIIHANYRKKVQVH